MSKIEASDIMEHEHSHKIIMVCVTRQRTCERLIREGEKKATELSLPLHIVHAVKTGENFLGNAIEGEALEYLFTAAQVCGGELSVLRADDVIGKLVEYAKSHDAKMIVLGRSPQEDDKSFANKLNALLPGVEINTI